MPFCTACGNQNPDDARFCAKCGARLVAGDGSTSEQAPESGDRAGEATTSITLGATAAEVAESPESQLNAADAAAVDALPPGHALLVVQRGPGSGSRFLLNTDVVNAGRHPDSEIFLDDVTVSRRHAEFRREGTVFSVSDVGSLNGTYVNRDRIDRVVLHDGDEVQIGKYRLVFFAGRQGS